jgi:hypothetical protein
MSILSGSISQKSTIFKSNADKQCAAMSMIALIKSICINISEWTTTVIDDILIKGIF